jgi:hypothetical protein
MFDDLETEEKDPERQKSTDWTGVIIGAALLPLLFYFRHIGKTDLGLNLCICLGMNLIVIRLRWNLRKHIWFWGVMALVLAIEIPLVINIQWPQEWVPGVALLPIGLAGALIALGAIGFVQKFIVKDVPRDEEE